MKILFKILTIFPIKIAFYIIDCLFFIMPIILLKLLSSFQVTKKNLTIAFPGLSKKEILKLSKLSFIETLKSFYETLYSWSRSSEKIIRHIKKINNRFLFSQSQNSTGLIIFAIHNRSIDFLLRWMSTQRQHTSLYKIMKSKKVNNFVKRVREEGGNKMVPTGIGGVKSIIAALKNNQMTCMGSDQVPADGLGKYSKFFGHECFSFSLAPSLARKTNMPILMASLSYDSSIGHIMTFKKPDAKIYGDSGVDIMNHEMETEILKCPKEYSWEYKKFRKLSVEPKDIYKD
jgi:KDO2-lipid IV(A) lauroyltransferase